MFLLYHSKRCNICEMVPHECYVNDLHTTTCSGMLGHHRMPQGPKEGGTWSHMLTAWWAPSQPSSIISMQSWTLRNLLDPKPTIYTPFRWFREGAVEKYKIHHTNLKTTRIGGETLLEPLPIAPSPPSTSSPLATCVRGISSPPGHGDCGINLYQTLSCAS
jgi:hypothetical protein